MVRELRKVERGLVDRTMERISRKTGALRGSILIRNGFYSVSRPLSDFVSNLGGGKSLLAENIQYASLKQKKYN